MPAIPDQILQANKEKKKKKLQTGTTVVWSQPKMIYYHICFKGTTGVNVEMKWTNLKGISIYNL